MTIQSAEADIQGNAGPDRTARSVLTVIRSAFLLPIRLYQRLISPLLPAMCRYEPTCSQYMIEAVQKRGIFIGTLKGLWRICRCQPLCKGGWDPVDPHQPPPAITD